MVLAVLLCTYMYLSIFKFMNSQYVYIRTYIRTYVHCNPSFYFLYCGTRFWVWVSLVNLCTTGGVSVVGVSVVGVSVVNLCTTVGVSLVNQCTTVGVSVVNLCTTVGVSLVNQCTYHSGCVCSEPVYIP